MRTMLVWELLICYTTVVISQEAQSIPTQYVQLGGTVNLTCHVNSVHRGCLWYKDNQDGRLYYVYFISCQPYQATDKYLAYCINAQNNLFMNIKMVETTDAGIYYYTDPTMKPSFIVSSMLVTTETFRDNPRVSILVPIQDSEAGTLILLCVALSSSDKWSSIRWHLNGNISDVQTTLYPDGSIRSLIILPENSIIRDFNVTCSIQEVSSQQIIQDTYSPAQRTEIVGDSHKNCYTVLYIGLVFIIIILATHGILVIRQRRASGIDPTVRKSKVEMVTYSAVKTNSTATE